MIDEQQLYICHKCVSDEFLKQEMQAEGMRGRCSYCDKIRKVIKLSWLAERIHSAIKSHFNLTSNEPTPLEYALLSDKESNYDWERHGVPVNVLIQDIAGVDKSIANNVNEYLSLNFGGDPKDFEENPYADDAHYEESAPDKYQFQKSWDFFCQEIKCRARFFSQSAEKVLDELFSDLYSLRTHDEKSVIHIAGPGTENPYIYRARVSQSQNTLDLILKNPVQELCAPPSRLSKPGRMNAVGISVFYGATDAETCVAEVRPPVGSHVVVGCFKIIRDIRLLDLNILSQIYAKGSYFDPEFKNREAHAAFLRHLVEELTKPVMPDEETFEYLPTQVVAEYLAEKIKPNLDGIIYNSSQIQAQGQNIILFHNSCGVEPHKLLPGTTISINYGWSTDEDEDYDDNITVFEELSNESSVEQLEISNMAEFQGDWVNCRNRTLRLDVYKDIDVMVIEGAKYQTRKRYTSRFKDVVIKKDETEAMGSDLLSDIG